MLRRSRRNMTQDVARFRVASNPVWTQLRQLFQNKAVENSRLRPSAHGAAADWCRHVANLTNVVWMILPYWPHCVTTWRHPLNRKNITYFIIGRKRPSYGVITRTENLVKFGMRFLRYVSRQTDRQTLIAILRTCNTLVRSRNTKKCLNSPRLL